MKFSQVFDLMYNSGLKIKRPHWSGYWEWDTDGKTIVVHCRPEESDDGICTVLDIRRTTNIERYIRDMIAEDWVLATENNVSKDTLHLSFVEAFNKMYSGKRIRLPRMHDSSYISYVVTAQGGKEPREFSLMENASISSPYCPTVSDINSRDWIVVDE